jgi:hypothetical protein
MVVLQLTTREGYVYGIADEGTPAPGPQRPAGT